MYLKKDGYRPLERVKKPGIYLFLQYLKKFGYFGCRPEPPTGGVQVVSSHVKWTPRPPTNVPPSPAPPEKDENPGMFIVRLPPPPGILTPSWKLLWPPLHILLSSLQFTFANAGLAAPILVVIVAAATIAPVITITKSLVCCIMHGILIIVFIYIY